MKNITQMVPRSGRKVAASHDMRQALAGMHYRASELNGRTANLALGDVSATLGNSFKLMDAPRRLAEETMEAYDARRQAYDGRRVELCKLIDDARAGDLESQHELNALHATAIDLYVRATSNFTQFYQEVPLAPDEQAVFETTFRNEVKVKYIGQDGGPRSQLLTKAKKQVFIDMRLLTTDEVVYPIRDLNTGTDVASMSQATVDLGFDMANKVDLDAFTLFKTLLGAFRQTGAKLDRTWVASTRIITANLPTTNVYQLDTSPFDVFESAQATTASKLLFRLAVCRATMQYCAAWGNIFGGPVKPTGVIMIPASEATQLSSEITPTGSTYNPIADSIMQNFTQFDYMGIRWILVPDVTLPKGTCYPLLNRPVGHMYTKPGFDIEDVQTDKRKNIENRVQMKAINFAAPEPWRVFAFSVIYHP